MQLPPQSDRMTDTRWCPTDAEDLVYDLQLKDRSPDYFYANVARSSDRLLAEAGSRGGAAIDGYSHHLQLQMRDPP